MTKRKTMSEDLLRRKDVIEAIHNYWKKRLDTLPTKESECGEVYADIQQVDKILEHNKILCNFINALPSADRPQGEWIEHEHGFWTFVNDKGERDGWIPDYECNLCGARAWKVKTKFCPTCGARMKGVDDE